MKRTLILLLAVGCGRLGFDSSGASTDAEPADACVLATVCDPLTGSGCCDGNACYLDVGMNAKLCEPAGIARENDHCLSTNDCEPGTTCASDAGYASCRRACAIDADCTNGVGSLCAYAAGPGRVCSQACDPVAGTGCAPDGGCRVNRASNGAFMSECRFAGAGTQGSGCAGDQDCEGGYTCVTNTCHHNCRVGSNVDCITPKVCVGQLPKALIGGVEYGTCDP